MENGCRILYCHCSYAQVVPKDVKEEVLRKLAESGRSFDAVADLCEMSARKDPALNELAASGDVKIVACYPRAVKWLFNAAGVKLPEQGVDVLNMRTEPAENIVNAVLGPGFGGNGKKPEQVQA
jgi:hypothetical protein